MSQPGIGEILPHPYFSYKIFFVHMSKRAECLGKWDLGRQLPRSSNRARQIGAQLSRIPTKQPIPVGGMKFFQLRMREITC